MNLKNFPNINAVRFGEGSTPYFGPAIWNSMPAEIRNANTWLSFNKKIENGSHQIDSVNFVWTFWVELVL